MSHETVFIPIKDIEFYEDYDNEMGYSCCDQLFLDDGIIVLKKDEQQFRDHVQKMNEYKQS